MGFDMVKASLDYLRSIWKSGKPNSGNPVTVISFYGGEPLLNMPLIQQTIDYVESLDIDRVFRFSMTTNAMLLHRHMGYFVDKKSIYS